MIDGARWSSVTGMCHRWSVQCARATWRDSVKLSHEEDRAEVGGEDHQTVRSKREATDEMHVDSEEDSLQAA